MESALEPTGLRPKAFWASLTTHLLVGMALMKGNRFLAELAFPDFDQENFVEPEELQSEA